MSVDAHTCEHEQVCVYVYVKLFYKIGKIDKIGEIGKISKISENVMVRQSHLQNAFLETIFLR
jgi:hypothetical protein